MHRILCEDPTGDKMLTAALSAIGYNADDYPAACILRRGHPIWDTATENGRFTNVVFVAMNTKGEQSCISNMDVPLHKDFHNAICEYSPARPEIRND